MATRQSTLGILARPGNFDLIERSRDAVSDITPDLGVPLGQFTTRAGELSDDTGVLRYQYSTTYEYAQRSGDDVEYGDVQFRTTLYTLTDPSDDVKRYLKNTTHHRLRALFDTTTEYDGYMTGFNFMRKHSNTENARPVGQDEIPATGLGVPNFSVEVYDPDGDLAGYSTGYSLDFGVHETTISTPSAPDQETWKITKGRVTSGTRRYQLGPKSTPSRKRAANIKGKTIYINGFPTGTVVQDGRAWLTKEHQRPGAATYRSRRYIIDNSGTPYQALSPGSNLYKVAENDSELYFSTVEPQGFDAVDPDDVDPDATGVDITKASLDLLEDEPTEFVVTADVPDPWALGKYNATLSKTIRTGTDFTLHPPKNPAGGRP